MAKNTFEDRFRIRVARQIFNQVMEKMSDTKEEKRIVGVPWAKKYARPAKQYKRKSWTTPHQGEKEKARRRGQTLVFHTYG